jgi:hypothetical protein
MSKKEKGSRILKWVAAASAVIGLIIGVSQVGKLFTKWKEEKEKINSLISVARVQLSGGDYHGAWDNLEKAHEVKPNSEEVQSEQAAVAMLWLKNIRISSARGEEKFSDITNKLLPALYHEVSVSTGRQKANALAFIGWVSYLKFRDGERDMSVEENFRSALKEDSSNAYAHVMLGFWMLFPGSNTGSPEEAKKHFEEASSSGADERFVRNLKLSAYRNANYDLEYTKEIFLIVNEMRLQHDTLDEDTKRRILSDAYQSNARWIDTIATVLTPAEHFDTFVYLTAEKKVEESLMLTYAMAAITERLPDAKGALNAYKIIASHEAFPMFRYKKQVEEAIKRLSGKEIQ